MANVHRGRIDGFTLLEAMICLVVTLTVSGITLPAAIRLMSLERLNLATADVTGSLHWAQSMAESTEIPTIVQFTPYSPSWKVMQGGRTLLYHAPPQGVVYVDGQLQLSGTRVSYQPTGGADTAGVIRFLDGDQQSSVHLYMGSGLSVSNP